MALQSTTALATITLQSASSNVIFSNIPSNYRDLALVADAIFSSGSENLMLRFNGDSNTNYLNVYMFGTGTTTGASPVSGTGILGGGLTTANRTLQRFQILDYSLSDKHKSTINRTDTNNDATYVWAGRWGSISPINSIEVRGSGSGVFAAGSTFSLYGRIA